MGSIRIVTDSASDIPPELRQELGIEMVPLKILFGEETYYDAVTINTEQFFEKVAAATEMPTSSQPSPLEYQEVYERILQEDPGASIISIHLSGAVSGTYQSAVIGSSMVDGDPDITVIDSKTASYAIGMRVVAAARMAREGASKEAIMVEIERMERETQLYFLVDTLEYLQRGGRIGKASALIGSILNIKPILSLDKEGMVYAVDKMRGTKKAMARIMDLLSESCGQDPVIVTIAWNTNKEAALEFLELIKSRFNVQGVEYATVGAVIGTHVGPGTMAVFVRRV
ncbi:DegV family protein [Paenibacillus glycanilyticus]|uniref:Fatty acid-binding protein DegV n=1 Tax=Paenibacillus glycanilyticus TaxID=126569 RepID=A0ABQ6GC09_9BACL|nr:DegV family protein [Paenibacillus glycanilyticus]GLX68413.1 fatty acid-binding protein DegV [Paenibacillus glycanilyticus]